MFNTGTLLEEDIMSKVYFNGVLNAQGAGFVSNSKQS